MIKIVKFITLFITSFNIVVSYKKRALFNSLIYEKLLGSEESRFHLKISQSRAAAFHYVHFAKYNYLYARDVVQSACGPSNSLQQFPENCRPPSLFLSVLKGIQHGETEPALLRIRETVLVNIVTHSDSQIPSM
jgi:hypothetical protein